MLRCCRKETGSSNFFPEIEARLVPVLRCIFDIVLYDGPDDVGGCIAVSVGLEPASVCDESSGSQRWSISLRPTPTSHERGTIWIELGLPHSGSIRERPRRVRKSLQFRLRRDVIVDFNLQVRVSRGNESIYQALEDERRITSPCKEIYGRQLALQTYVSTNSPDQSLTGSQEVAPALLHTTSLLLVQHLLEYLQRQSRSR